MDEKIINRRSFFKKAASVALPILAMVTVPTLLTSCEIDEPLPGGGGSSSGCNECKGGCGRGCTSNCGVSCGNKCQGHCGGGCSSGCGTTCRGLCSKSNKY